MRAIIEGKINFCKRICWTDLLGVVQHPHTLSVSP